MNHIHEIDDDVFNSLKNMLSSNDKTDINIAIEILNNSNIKDKSTLDNICRLLIDGNSNVTFDLDKPGDLDSFKFYSIQQFSENYKDLEYNGPLKQNI